MKKLIPFLPALDSRSLSLFRILIALVILADLSLRLGRFTEHYTENGISPACLRFDATQEKFQNWSLFFLFQGATWIKFLWGLLTVSSLTLLVGYHTRLSSVLTWALMLSLHAQSPLICYGADRLIAVLLFWAMWLPLGNHWSFDARKKAIRCYTISGGAAFGLTLQVALVYWMNAITKSGIEWRIDYTAIEHTLKIDSFSTNFGEALLHFPVLLKAGTYFTLYLEELGPFLLFLPFFRGCLKTCAVFFFVFFHLGLLGTTLHLGIFPYVGAVAWLPFLPDSFWDFVSKSKARYALLEAPKFRSVICIFLAIYVLLWNVRTVISNKNPWFLPKSVNWVGELTRLNQKWSLFAPRPNATDGWLIAAATLHDGKKVDLINYGAALDFTRPEELATRFRGCRERGYELYLFQQPQPQHVDFFVQSLKRRWRAAGGSAIDDFTLYFMEENNVEHPGKIKCYQLWPYDATTPDGNPIFKELPMPPSAL